MDFDPKVAYFSMEIGFRSDIPTYAGGLGVLAGDFMKAAADMEVPMVGVSLLYDYGYFKQHIINNKQYESYEQYYPSKDMKELPEKVSVKIQGREVKVRAWLYELEGKTGFKIPMIFLDTNGDLNTPWDGDITNQLYGGTHPYHRITQEVVLGVGGVRMLEKLGFNPEVYHLNEGHGSFATLELRRKFGGKSKERTVFTTHTPVPAGHDRFDYGLVYDVLQEYVPNDIRKLAGEGEFNTTILALNMSRYANAVAKLHGVVSNNMFPHHNIDYITNGVHSYTWTSPEFQALFDKHIPSWRDSPVNLRAAHVIPDDELLQAHASAKSRLIEVINKSGTISVPFDPNKPLIGFARRFAPYKRADLIFRDLERLREVGSENLQLVFAGKSHPNNIFGKELIQRVLDFSAKLKGEINIAFLENYNMDLGALMTAGSDVWLNTPLKPNEASGTSGMKAAHNGVPHFSTIDGWWCEAYDKGGWSIGGVPGELNRPSEIGILPDEVYLYNVLENEVLPNINDPLIKKDAIVNASYFNMERMMQEYLEKAYKIS